MKSKYTKEILEKEIKKAISISDLVRIITGKKEVSSSSHNLVSKKIKLYNLDISHFIDNNINKKNNNKMIEKKDILRFNPLMNTREKRHKLLKAMLNEGIIYKCNSCGINPEWNKKPLKLDIDHIDGNWKNNNIKNLRFLCPNCHSQTETYGYTNKEKNFYYKFSAFSTINLLLTKTVCCFDYETPKTKIKVEKQTKVKEKKQIKIKPERKKYFCKFCNNEVSYNSKTYCKSCNAINKRKIKERPTIEILKKELENLGSYVELSKKYGVSDNAIRKWIKKECPEKISSELINFEKKIKEIYTDINNNVKISITKYKYYYFIQKLKSENIKNNLSKEKLDLIKEYNLPFFDAKSPKEILEERKIEYIAFIKEQKRKPIFNDKVPDKEKFLARWFQNTKRRYLDYYNDLNKEIEKILK